MAYTPRTVIFVCGLLWVCVCDAQVQQKNLQRIDAMAEWPKPFGIIDYKQLAKNFDKKVYDFSAHGDYWPLIWVDSSNKNFNQATVGLYTAIGDARQGKNNKGMFHEALNSMGAVLGASLVGIDKSKQQYNYVGMLKNYFNRETGWNIMMNNTCPEVALLGGGYGRDWWYDVYPNLLFYAIYNLYPEEKDFDWIAKTIADKFYSADSALNGNYNYTYFNYGAMQPHKTEICIQPDAAAGHAWVLYMAYKKFGDRKYLNGAYSVIVSNTYGSATSAAALLTVVIPPLPGSFGFPLVLADGSLQLVMSGSPNSNYVLEYTTNWMNWTALTNFASASGLFEFDDTSVATNRYRFYRVRLVP